MRIYWLGGAKGFLEQYLGSHACRTDASHHWLPAKLYCLQIIFKKSL